MANANKIYGSKVVFVKAETTAGTWVHPDTTDAIKNIGDGTSFGKLQREKNKINEARPDRGSNAEADGRLMPIAWSLKDRYRPSGTAGTGCAEFLVLMAAAGFTVTDGESDIKYAINTSPPVDKTLSIYTIDRDAKTAEQIIGACVSQLVISANKTAAEGPTFAWSGECMRKIEIYETKLDTGIDDSATAMVLPSLAAAIRNGDTGDIAGEEIYMKFATGEIVKITAVTRATGSVTIVRAQKTTSKAAHLADEVISPWDPTPDYTGIGAAIDPHKWSFSWGGAALPVQSCEITYTTGIMLADLESPYHYATSLKAGEALVAASFAHYMTPDNIVKTLLADINTESAAILQLGTVAGSQAKIYLDHSKIIDVPDLSALAYNEAAVGTYGLRCNHAATVLDAIEIVED
jgi:hypothetical protein